MGDTTTLVRDFAHDLRNAISPARSAADLLRLRGADPAARDKALAHIERSVDAALRTIDAFVAADRAHDGSLSLDIAPVALDALVRDAVSLASIDGADPANLHVPTGEAAPHVDVDRNAAASALASVIAHARASGGDVAIEVEHDGGQATLRVWHREPRDDASAPDFETFRSVPGTGAMALRTARRMLELQHGSLVELGADASGRRGFEVKLARGSAPARETTTASAPAAHAPRNASAILLVDDNAALRSTYADALEEMGYEVTAVADGDAAIDAAARRLPDVALIDIHLPTIGGYQVARTLRSDPKTAGIRLVMLSGMTLDETTRRLSLNAGFDDCIDKMAGPGALDRLLRAS